MTVCWTFEMEHYKKKMFTQNVAAALLISNTITQKKYQSPVLHVHTESFTINLRVWKVSSMLPLDADQMQAVIKYA